MDIRYCPRCGSSEVSINSWNDHYKRKTTRECDDCEWHYSTGTYVNTGGTHPKQFQRWCSDCECTFETVERAANHTCTVEGLIEDHGQPVTVDGVFDELEAYLSEYKVRNRIEDGIRERRLQIIVDTEPQVALRPDRNAVTPMHEAALDVIRSEEPVTSDEIKSELGLESRFADRYLQQCLRELDDRGIITMTIRAGYEIQSQQRP